MARPQSCASATDVTSGSFQAGSAAGINPLVNTQFQYIDVGVNADITPRVHRDHEVSLKISIAVSSATGNTSIGGIQQPIISQRKIEHEIRLKEGEASILGGLFERIDTKTLNGWRDSRIFRCFVSCSPARAQIIRKTRCWLF
jgi:general secretion pathway protein D